MENSKNFVYIKKKFAILGAILLTLSIIFNLITIMKRHSKEEELTRASYEHLKNTSIYLNNMVFIATPDTSVESYTYNIESLENEFVALERDLSDLCELYAPYRTYDVPDFTNFYNMDLTIAVQNNDVDAIKFYASEFEKLLILVSEDFTDVYVAEQNMDISLTMWIHYFNGSYTNVWKYSPE